MKRQARHHPTTTPRERATLTSKLNYPEFLDALLVLGERMYNGKKIPKVSELSASKKTTAAAGGGHCGRSVESMFQQVSTGVALSCKACTDPGIAIALSCKAGIDPGFRD